MTIDIAKQEALEFALEEKLIAAGLGYPLSKEDAVKAYKTMLVPRADTPENADCPWCFGVGHDFDAGLPCVGCCEPAKPVMDLIKSNAGLIAENEELGRYLCTCRDCGGEGSLHTGDWHSYSPMEPPEPVMEKCGECDGTGLLGEVQDLYQVITERDQLRAENAGLKTGYQAYERVNAELQAEVEALRKDADKWQIVESAMTQLQSDEHGAAIWSACSRILISVSSDLNSGRSVVTEEGVTIGDREIGDWRVTVERIDAAMGKGEQ